MTRTMSLAGTTLELVERGHGQPLLFLHPGEGLAPEKPWLELLSRQYRVIAPWHPGYGNSPLIDGSGSVDDLAYLYLDLAAELKFEDAVLVGACFGGWIAAEMMVRSTARFSHLVLVDPLGIKISGREERDIADMHALPRAEYLKLAWADPPKGDADFTKLPESELAAIVRGREAFALYGIREASFGLCRPKRVEGICGAVRFVATGKPKWVAWCHRQSCRKHSGAPVSVFAAFERTDYTVTKDEITKFNSSPRTRRGFCSKCGSTLTCESVRLPTETHFHVGAFDDAAPSADQAHIPGRAVAVVAPGRRLNSESATRSAPAPLQTPLANFIRPHP